MCKILYFEKSKSVLLFAFLTLLFTACGRMDFDDMRRNLEKQQVELDEQGQLIITIENIAPAINSSIINMQRLILAQEGKSGVDFYESKPDGYRLTMSDGSTIDLKHNRIDENAPNIGMKKDSDGEYYWTIDDDFIIQNDRKIEVNAVTAPKLKVDVVNNIWQISTDDGGNWDILLDGDNNLIPVIEPKGNSGLKGDNNLTIVEGDGVFTITFKGETYVFLQASMKVVSGGYVSFYLNHKGVLYATGKNNFGQLGLGNTSDQSNLQRVMDNVRDVATGGSHALILTIDGQLYVTGSNQYGQIGVGNIGYYEIRTLPTIVPGMDNVKAIATGTSHSLILKADGRLYVMGFNQYGQLGLGDNTNRTLPTELTGISDVKSISTGKNHSLILKNDGTLYTMGDNIYGQLGLGDKIDRKSPTRVTEVSDIKYISAGDYRSFIITNEGSLYAMGMNDYGELGVGSYRNQKNSPSLVTGINDIKSISSGGYHTLILKSDGSLYGMGDNSLGQLGLGNGVDYKTLPTLLPGINSVKDITAGGAQSLILKSNGTLYSTGLNSNGQLGLGNTTSFYDFVRTPSF